MDGEGCIIIGLSKPAPYNELKNPSHWLQVQITNTDKNLINWLKISFGGHISDNSKSKRKKKRRPCYAWRILSNEAMEFLEKLLPYLRTKKRQAILAIEFQKSRRGQNNIPLTDEELLNRDLYKKKISDLNRGREIGRGPPEFRPAEDKTTTPPVEAVQVYPVKQEASLLVGR